MPGATERAASTALTTAASPFWSLSSTITDLAPATFARVRSLGLVGSPRRRTTRSEERSPAREAISSCISSRSRSAKITTSWPRAFCAATASSLSTGNTRGDQPSTSTWPASTTGLLPLRSAATRPWMRLVMKPITVPVTAIVIAQ